MFAKPVHPFLIALFPILFLFSNNMDIVPGRELAIPMAVCILMTVVVFLCFKLVTKSYNKAGLITSVFLLLFFLYGSVRDFVFSPNARVSVTINFIMLSIWTAVFLIMTLAIMRSHSNFDTETKFMNIAALSLLVLTQISIGINYSKAVDLAAREKAEASQSSALMQPDSRPDIYYIILDRYGRQDALKETFDYDNSEFTNYLAGKGFYVADQSYSNYDETLLSMPSSLNMRYLTNTEGENPDLLLEAWKNNAVMQSLRSIGYQTIFIDSDLRLKGMKQYAQVFTYSGIGGIPTGPFEEALCDMTVLSPISRLLGGHGAAVSYALNTITAITDNSSPKFIYAHIICPHPPYIFNAGGEEKFKLFGNTTDDKTGYPSNLDFINGKMRGIIDWLLSKDRKPIIIVQGDHFMNFAGQQNIFKVLNAYYLPGKDYATLSENISPVNSFRAIFNLYFNGNNDILQNTSYYWNAENKSFMEITGKHQR
ncbi:MAG: hypothetical protein EHM12_02280 [Dehalococcoidia bacterium]|nr:MAG: hypothetical protein EHM12_02280 [Dehalococcoidia bacterium]